MMNILLLSISLKRATKKLIGIFFLVGIFGLVNGYSQARDSLLQGDDSTRIMRDTNVLTPSYDVDTLSLSQVKQLPYSYIGEMLDGRMAGINAIRSSGEPGVAPLAIIRGLSVPIGSEKDVYSNRPLYVVDGMPLIRNDNPYQLAIKEFDFTGIGSGIDISALLDIDNISNIEVLKGADAVARYGVHAANGAIVLTTRKPRTGAYNIGVRLYGGVAIQPPVNTKNGVQLINGAFERDFQMPFYQKYASNANLINFPAYLSDSTDATYFGPSNWTDLYYREALQHGLDMNISGGNERASFRFGIGEHTENGVVDQTALKRYNVYYDMYIIPIKNLSIRTYVQAATADRNRNNSLRERFAEMEYFPDQTYPLSPNKDYLSQYYSYLDEGNDKNKANSIQGLFKVKYDVLSSLSLNSQFSVDYNDNHRDYFVPGALNDGNSYNSYFSGINRRIRWDNFALFDKSFSNESHLQLQLGQTLEYDRMQYSYIRGYRGPSDFIKIIQVGYNDDGSDNWITHDKNFVYAYKDYLQQQLFSFYGHASYSLKDKYFATLSLRSDGSSYFGNGYHWAVSPSLSLKWDVTAEPWLQSSNLFDALAIKANAGRTARLPSEDYYGYGPYYTVDIGWQGSEKVSTYASYPTLSLPFTDGYVGGGIKWPYTDQWDIGAEATLLHKLNLSLTFYSKTNRDLLISVPTGGAAYGFSGQWLNGMAVQNTGLEASLGGNFNLGPEVQWQSSIAFSYNKNKLLSLPNGLNEITYGNRHLEVGKSTDQFWLLQNEGIYESDGDVPVTNGAKLSYNGIPFQAGDPKWKDVNHDGVINDEDRVMEGHIIAPVHGGWNNSLTYKKWSLGFSFVYSFGNNVLNGAAASRFDFANREGSGDMNGVKELTFWEVKGNLNDYPRYNPWSLVNPYQTDQTLFYAKANFVKLQSVTVQYDMTQLPVIKKANIEAFKIYVTGQNLFLSTPYNGNDPSLIDYYGYDYGYAQPLPITFTVGLKVDF